MSLLDQLQAMYGIQQPEEPDPVQQMAQVEPPPPPELDPAVMSATTDDMSQPQSGSDQSLGHPDVLSFIKELDQSGRLTGGKEPGAPKGMGAASSTYKTEIGGVPDDVQATGVAVRGQEQLDNGMVDANRLKRQADELEQRAAYLRQDAEVQNEARQRQEAENAAKQERLRAQQAELAGQADEPINPNRYFENMSGFSKLTSLMSAAIYGYLGGQGQPPIVETLTQNAKMDVQAQLQNNAAAGARRNSLIDQYERQYGDTTLVAKRLEADKLLTLSKAAQAEAMTAKSAEAKAAAEDLVSKLQNHVGVLHQEIQEATYGKPVEVSTTYQTPKPKGAGVDPLKAAAEVVANGEKAGFSKDAIAAELKQRGLPVPTGDSAFQTEERRKAKDQELQEAKARELSPAEKTDLMKKADGLAETAQALTELDNTLGFKRDANGDVIAADEDALSKSIKPSIDQFSNSALRGVPFKIGAPMADWSETKEAEEVKKVKRIADKIVFGQAKAEGQGAMSDGDRVTYRARLPVTNGETLKRSSAEIWRSRKQQYENMVGQYGKANADAMMRARGVDPKTLGG